MRTSLPPARQRAVFLDKDGTLIEDVPYNVDPSRIVLARGAGEGLRRLAELGFALVVVSNQSGVARGLFAESALVGVERKIGQLLAEFGVRLAGLYYCPHHPEAKVEAYRRRCSCRKPQPGMLRRAARDLALDLRQSWLIGDILDDVEAGCRAGCRSVLIDAGHETEWSESPYRRPEYVAGDLDDAARWIAAAAASPHAAEVLR